MNNDFQMNAEIADLLRKLKDTKSLSEQETISAVTTIMKDMGYDDETSMEVAHTFAQKSSNNNS